MGNVEKEQRVLDPYFIQDKNKLVGRILIHFPQKHVDEGFEPTILGEITGIEGKGNLILEEGWSIEIPYKFSTRYHAISKSYLNEYCTRYFIVRESPGRGHAFGCLYCNKGIYALANTQSCIGPYYHFWRASGFLRSR